MDPPRLIMYTYYRTIVDVNVLVISNTVVVFLVPVQTNLANGSHSTQEQTTFCY